MLWSFLAGVATGVLAVPTGALIWYFVSPWFEPAWFKCRCGYLIPSEGKRGIRIVNMIRLRWHLWTVKDHTPPRPPDFPRQGDPVRRRAAGMDDDFWSQFDLDGEPKTLAELTEQSGRANVAAARQTARDE